MKKITVILLCMAMLLSGCAWGVKAEAVSSSEDVWKTIEEAYIYAFPLVLMDATRTSATNTEEAAPGRRLLISSCTVWHWPTRSSKTW